MLQGAIAGAVAGLIASWAMESFQAAWSTASTQLERDRVLTRAGAGRRGGAKGGPEDPAVTDLPPRYGDGAPATARVASDVAEPVPERELTDEESPIAGEAVHHASGGMNGALYGAVADVFPPIRAANGMLFGAALWLAADEVGLWRAGLAKRPTQFPTSMRAYALASHLAYGLTLETVRRAIRWLVV